MRTKESGKFWLEAIAAVAVTAAALNGFTGDQIRFAFAAFSIAGNAVSTSPFNATLVNSIFLALMIFLAGFVLMLLIKSRKWKLR